MRVDVVGRVPFAIASVDVGEKQAKAIDANFGGEQRAVGGERLQALLTAGSTQSRMLKLHGGVMISVERLQTRARF